MTGLASLFDNPIVRGTRSVIERTQSMPKELSVMNDAPSHDQSAKGSHDLLCPQCQLGQLSSRHCKRICELCGYIESCEDVFPRMPAGSDAEQQRVKRGGPSVPVKARATLGGIG